MATDCYPVALPRCIFRKLDSMFYKQLPAAGPPLNSDGFWQGFVFVDAGPYGNLLATLIRSQLAARRLTKRAV